MKDKIVDVMLIAGFVFIAVLLIAMVVHGEQSQVKVFYLEPSDVKEAQVKWQALKEAEAEWQAFIGEVGKHYAQEEYRKVQYYVDTTKSFNGQFAVPWYSIPVVPGRPHPPAQDGYRWRDGWEWGFNFLSDFSGIVPASEPSK